MTVQDKHITRIADLIVAELTGKIDDSGRRELENWKHETPEHLRLYDLYQSTDFVARKFEFIKEYSAIEAYQEFAGRVVQAKRRKRTWALYRYVAAILLFVLGGSYYFFHGAENEPISFVQKIQPGSYKAILTEPDGTKIDISDTTFLAFIQKEAISRKSEDEVTEVLYHTITIPRGGEYDLLLSDGSRLRMNSESEQRLSLQELKQRNTQQAVLPTLTTPHEACPSKADWERMMKYMDALWYHADRQTDLLESISRQMSQLPTRTQLDDLLKMVRHLEQMTEQAGKPKENSFSLHRIRLPRLHLPHVSIPALISLLMAAAALLLLWWGLGTVWSRSSLLPL